MIRYGPRLAEKRVLEHQRLAEPSRVLGNRIERLKDRRGDEIGKRPNSRWAGAITRLDRGGLPGDNVEGDPEAWILGVGSRYGVAISQVPLRLRRVATSLLPTNVTVARDPEMVTLEIVRLGNAPSWAVAPFVVLHSSRNGPVVSLHAAGTLPCATSTKKWLTTLRISCSSL
jgi:hypothetical protein